MFELWMTIVGISMALSGIPQVIRILKRRSSSDISLSLWIIVLHGQLWWFYYGFAKESISLILTNALCVLIGLILIYLTIKYRK